MVKTVSPPVEEIAPQHKSIATVSGLPGRYTLILLLGSLSAFGPLSLDTYLPALAAPLVGIAGEDTAVPMAIIIAVASCGALLAFTVLSKPLKKNV